MVASHQTDRLDKRNHQKFSALQCSFHIRRGKHPEHPDFIPTLFTYSTQSLFQSTQEIVQVRKMPWSLKPPTMNSKSSMISFWQSVSTCAKHATYSKTRMSS